MAPTIKPPGVGDGRPEFPCVVSEATRAKIAKVCGPIKDIVAFVAAIDPAIMVALGVFLIGESRR
jgi:hypothetical protein